MIPLWDSGKRFILAEKVLVKERKEDEVEENGRLIETRVWSYAFTWPIVKDGRIAGRESVDRKSRRNPRSTAKRLFSRARKAASRALLPLDIRICRFLVSLNILETLLFFSEMSSEMREGASRVGNLSEDDILLSRPFVDRFYRYLSSKHDPPTSVERRRYSAWINNRRSIVFSDPSPWL